MAKIIELPKLSPTMEEGTLVRWAKNEGDPVDIDEVVAEVDTDKATMEFRAFDRGTLLKRLVAEGTTLKLGEPVAIFGTPGEDITALLAQVAKGSAPAPPKPAETPAPATASAPAAAIAAEPATAKVSAAPPAVTVARVPSGPAQSWIHGEAGRAGIVLLPVRKAAGDAETVGRASAAPLPSSPRVRKIARERGIPLEVVRGTGDRGRITVEDIERAPTPSGSAASRAVAKRAEDTIRPASQMRKAIARRLTESKRDVPHFYLEADLDVEALLALREQLNDGVDKEAKVSINDLFVRACALALREVPTSNASWIDGTIVVRGNVDVSLAVAVDDGLVTPVLRDADTKSIRTIAAETKDLAVRARAKKLRLEEMQGGTFSLSNLGMYGVDRFSAVINPPEGMILAVGATRDVPVVKAGAIVPGLRCAVTLSCDHRVVDGALGATFLKALRALVERPVKILA